MIGGSCGRVIAWTSDRVPGWMNVRVAVVGWRSERTRHPDHACPSERKDAREPSRQVLCQSKVQICVVLDQPTRSITEPNPIDRHDRSLGYHDVPVVEGSRRIRRCDLLIHPHASLTLYVRSDPPLVLVLRIACEIWICKIIPPPDPSGVAAKPSGIVKR